MGVVGRIGLIAGMTWVHQQTIRRGLQRARYRVLRGGCWSIPARFCRSVDRYCFEPGNRYGDLGLRVSRVPADK